MVTYATKQFKSATNILLGCIGAPDTARVKNWYRWHHDKVLFYMADIIEQERCKKRSAGGSQKKAITFIKKGARPRSSSTRKPNLLQAAYSWEMSVDFGRRMQFPEVVHTNLRPDIVLWSVKIRQCHGRRAARCQPLIKKSCDKDWRHGFPVEIGCRGDLDKSALHVLSALGLNELSKKQAACRKREEAEPASCWI